MPAGKTGAYRCSECGVISYHYYGAMFDPTPCGIVRMVTTDESEKCEACGGTGAASFGLSCGICGGKGIIGEPKREVKFVACSGTVDYDHYAGDLDYAK